MGKLKTGQPVCVPELRWMGERGLRVNTGTATLARYKQLVSLNLSELDDIIPTDDSILLVLKSALIKPGAPLPENLRRALAAVLPAEATTSGRRHVLEVEYGGEAGPDLPALASRAGLTEAAFIQCHAASDYTVAFLGFQPGFPYLRGLPQALASPRRETPRVHVAAGSVAIGGEVCGIYPAQGPGGWQLIGRTASVLFDPARAAPALLMPGDRVRFVPVSAR